MSSTIESLQSTRSDLESPDLRCRLRAVGVLLAICSASKPQQHAVGAFLRELISGEPQRRLLEIVVSDLRADDRTLRCAAARLICQLAYENLVNQESITQFARHGVSVGWLHIFSVPQRFQTTRESPLGNRPQATMSTYLQELVADSYGDVYDTVTRYYASGCQQVLPLWWQFPRVSNGTTNGEAENVPDPAGHALGFFLVPRQTQFLEQDKFYHEELLGSLDEADRAKLDAVRVVARDFHSVTGKPMSTEAFAKYCIETATDDRASIAWLLENGCSDSIAPLQTYTEAADELTWSQLFVFACMRLNTMKLATSFDVATANVVASLFRDLALTAGKQINCQTYVWLPVLVAAVTQHPSLPPGFKRQVQSLLRGSLPHHDHNKEEPWRVLLETKLERVVPVSWAVFLAQWRIAAEIEHRLGERQSLPVRRTSVRSVCDLRRSIVEHLHPASFRDLDQLRRELPKVSRLASHPDLNYSAASSLSSFREEIGPDEEEDGGDHPEPRRSSLAYNLPLFHRMQHSLAELDALGLQSLRERQQEKERILMTVAMNKQRAQETAEKRRRELDEKQREQEAKYAAAETRKAVERAKTHELQHKKHEQAARRKQLHDEDQEAYKQQLAEKLAQRDQELLAFREQRATRSHEEPVRRPSPPTTTKRPLSARAPTPRQAEALSPELLRQRALLYGRVVSKIYTADAVSRVKVAEKEKMPAIHLPHHLTRSFSVFSSSSFNVKAPVVKVTPPSSRRKLSPRYRRPLQRQVRKPTEQEDGNMDGDRDVDDQDERVDETLSPRQTSQRSKPPVETPETIHGSHENMCSTLVMQNAALAASERIHIPEIPAPHVEDPSVPPYVIAAQYEALDDQYKLNFKQRFNLKCVSHRLSYDVLKQYTKIVRRDMAWQAFHDKCSNANRIKYADFVAVAQLLGIVLSERKLLHVAKQLDPKKTGCVEWKAFYTWWSMQYSDQVTCASPRKSVEGK